MPFLAEIATPPEVPSLEVTSAGPKCVDHPHLREALAAAAVRVALALVSWDIAKSEEDLDRCLLTAVSQQLELFESIVHKPVLLSTVQPTSLMSGRRSCSLIRSSPLKAFHLLDFCLILLPSASRLRLEAFFAVWTLSSAQIVEASSVRSVTPRSVSAVSGVLVPDFAVPVRWYPSLSSTVP